MCVFASSNLFLSPTGSPFCKNGGKLVAFSFMLTSLEPSFPYYSFVSVHIDRHKRGQASSVVAGTQVQTNCNTIVSVWGYCDLMG